MSENESNNIPNQNDSDSNIDNNPRHDIGDSSRNVDNNNNRHVDEDVNVNKEEKSYPNYKRDSTSFAQQKYNAGREKVLKDIRKEFGLDDLSSVEDLKRYFDDELNSKNETIDKSNKKDELYSHNIKTKDNEIKELRSKLNQLQLKNEISNTVIQQGLVVNDMDYLQHRLNNEYRHSDGRYYHKNTDDPVFAKDGEFANLKDIINSYRDQDSGVLFKTNKPTINNTTNNVSNNKQEITNEEYGLLIRDKDFMNKINKAGQMSNFDMARDRNARIEIMKKFL